jgi:hypothetical protein
MISPLHAGKIETPDATPHFLVAAILPSFILAAE